VGQSDGTERAGNCAEIFAEAGWAVSKANQVDAVAGPLAPRSSWCRSLGCTAPPRNGYLGRQLSPRQFAPGHLGYHVEAGLWQQRRYWQL
jgi:hypothetical protein